MGAKESGEMAAMWHASGVATNGRETWTRRARCVLRRCLVRLNFKVFGWSRSMKKMDGIRCCHAATGLVSVLQASDILVLLLPNTSETQNIHNKETLSQCKKGVCVINAGRGSSIEENDLLEAMNVGTISGATLDVFHSEPLPKNHPFWKHPRILVTPHIAAKSRPSTAAKESRVDTTSPCIDGNCTV